MKRKGRVVLYSAVALLSAGGVLASVTSCDTTVKKEEDSWVSKYSISVERVDGVTVSVNKTKANQGDEVEVTVKVYDEGNYEIDKVYANDIAVGCKSSGLYVFNMPKGNVTVKATIKEKAKAATYLLTLPAKTDEYSVTANANVTGITAGTVVGLTITNKKEDSKYIEKVKVGDLLVGGENGFYKFIMPEKDVSVSITMGDVKARDSIHTLEVAEHSDDITVSEVGKSYWAGDLIRISVSTSDETKYIKTVKVNSNVIGGIDGVYSFTMPAEDTVISVETGLKDDLYEKFSVVLPVTDEDSLYSITASQVMDVKAGALVTLNITPKDASYYVKEVTMNGTKLVVEDEVSFYMPAATAVVQVTLAQDASKVVRNLSCSVAENDYFDYGFTDSNNNVITSALPGTKIKFWAISKETHYYETKQINSVRFKVGSSYQWVDPNNSTTDVYYRPTSKYGTYVEFTVGTEDVVVDSASPVDKEYGITYSASGISADTIVNTNSTTKAKKGETVKFYPVSPIDYELVGVSIKDRNNNIIEATYVAGSSTYYSSSNAYYKFTMPSGKVTVTLTYKGAKQIVSVITDGHAKIVDMRTESTRTTVAEGESTIDYGTNTNDRFAYVNRVGESIYWNVEVDDSSIYMVNKVTYTIDGVTKELSESGWGTNKYYYINKLPRFESLVINVTTKDSRVPVSVTETAADSDSEVTNAGELELKTYNSTTKTYSDFIGTKEDGTKYIQQQSSAITVYAKFNTKTEYVSDDAQYALVGLSLNTQTFTLTSVNADGYYAFSIWSSSIKDTNEFKYQVRKYTKVFKDEAVVGSYYGPNLVSVSSDYDYDSSETTSTKSYYALIVDEFARFGVTSGSASSSGYTSGGAKTPVVGTSLLTKDETNPNKFTYGTTSGTTDEIYYLGNDWVFYKHRNYASGSWAMAQSAFMKKGNNLSSYDSSKCYGASVDGTSSQEGIVRIGLKDGTSTWGYFDMKNNVYKVGLTVEDDSSAFTKGGVVTLKDGDEIFKTYEFTYANSLKEVTLDKFAGTYTAGASSTSDDGSLVLNGVGGSTLNGVTGTYEVESENEEQATIKVTTEKENVDGTTGNWPKTNNVIRRFVVDKATGTYTANNGKKVNLPTSYKSFKSTTTVKGSDDVDYTFLIGVEYDDFNNINCTGESQSKGKVNSGYVSHDLDLSSGYCDLIVETSRYSYLDGAATFKVRLVADSNNDIAKLIVNGTITNKNASTYYDTVAPRGTSWTFVDTEFLAA